ncbi:MAG TPA: DMT family transporter [Paracoccaceae bacterium]|nr:DMT family transporter [Paracoccaceae bacterium]
MRIFLLVTLVLVAFAANSVLCRLALAQDAIGPASFTIIRLVAGALCLATLVGLRRQGPLASPAGSFLLPVRDGSARAGLALLAYMVGFSFSYVTLETGTGALILFAGVQMTMFGGALVGGERPPMVRWAGAGLGLTGLAVLFLPGAAVPAPAGALLMAVAAAAWGVYSLIGRAAKAPILETARNFRTACLMGLVPLFALAFLAGEHASARGVLLAVLSGAVASGLGYALWYSVLPHLPASVAALAQLTVPIIALGGGMLFLGEPLTWRFAFAAALVLGGVAGAILLAPRPAR